MAAVMNDTFDSVVQNMIFQCDVAPVFADLVPVLQAYRLANVVALSVPMSEHNRNEMLGIVTGLTVATGTILNCYPRGAETALFYDLAGNRVDP